MKTKITTILATLVPVLGLGISTSASATCVQGCTTTLPPAPSTQTVMVGGTATFGGAGTALFRGQEGFAKVEKQGFGQVVVDMNAGGNLCGVNCQNGTFTFAGTAGEQVKAMAGVMSTKSGMPAMVTNAGVANAVVRFDFSKLAPAH